MTFNSSTLKYRVPITDQTFGTPPNISQEDSLVYPRVSLVPRALVRLKDVVHRLAEPDDHAAAFVFDDLLVSSPSIGPNSELIHNDGAEWDQP